MTDNILNIHPALRDLEEVSLASITNLARAYNEQTDKLSGQFFTAANEKLLPPFPVKLFYYSDNSGNLEDTADKEVVSALVDSVDIVSGLSGIKAPEVISQKTLAQSWSTSGFDLAQTTRKSLRGVGRVTFLNCAPRLDERGADGNHSNKGEPVYVGILPNGHVITANSRYNFTYFRDLVENGTLELFEAKVQPDGTQFRSRDIFPAHAAVLAHRLTINSHLWKSEMSLDARRKLLEAVGYIKTNEPALSAEDIPQLKQFSVASIDVHGNIKTNTRLSELDEQTKALITSGKPFRVQLGEKILDVRFTERMFDRKDGEAGLSEGSSGSNWIGAVANDGFLEVSIMGGIATEALGLTPADFKGAIELTLLDVVDDQNTDLGIIKCTAPSVDQVLCP